MKAADPSGQVSCLTGSLTSHAAPCRLLPAVTVRGNKAAVPQEIKAILVRTGRSATPSQSRTHTRQGVYFANVSVNSVEMPVCAARLHNKFRILIIALDVCVERGEGCTSSTSLYVMMSAPPYSSRERNIRLSSLNLV